MHRRRDLEGYVGQGLVEGEERGSHARGFLSAGGACEEGFEGGRVSRDSQPAARHGLSFEALASQERLGTRWWMHRVALTIQDSQAPHRPIRTTLRTTHGP